MLRYISLILQRLVRTHPNGTHHSVSEGPAKTFFNALHLFDGVIEYQETNEIGSEFPWANMIIADGHDFRHSFFSFSFASLGI